MQIVPKQLGSAEKPARVFRGCECWPLLGCDVHEKRTGRASTGRIQPGRTAQSGHKPLKIRTLRDRFALAGRFERNL